MSEPVEFLDLDDVLDLARRLLGDPIPLRDVGLLGSAVARPRTTVLGDEAYPTLWHKAAALLHSLVNNHTLVDGNKRARLALHRSVPADQRGERGGSVERRRGRSGHRRGVELDRAGDDRQHTRADGRQRPIVRPTATKPLGKRLDPGEPVPRRSHPTNQSLAGAGACSRSRGRSASCRPSSRVPLSAFGEGVTPTITTSLRHLGLLRIEREERSGQRSDSTTAASCRRTSGISSATIEPMMS